MASSDDAAALEMAIINANNGTPGGNPLFTFPGESTMVQNKANNYLNVGYNSADTSFILYSTNGAQYLGVGPEPTPEPATFAFLALGLGGAVFSRRRSRKTA